MQCSERGGTADFAYGDNGNNVHNYLDYDWNTNWYFVFEIVRLSPGKFAGTTAGWYIYSARTQIVIFHSFILVFCFERTSERAALASASAEKRKT